MGPQGMGMMGPQNMGAGMGPQGIGTGMIGPQGSIGMMGPQYMGPMNPSPASSKSSQSLPSVDSAFMDRGPMGMSSSGALKNVNKRHTPKRDLQSPASFSSGSSFGPIAGRSAGPGGPQNMAPQGMGNMGMGMNNVGMGMGMGNMAMGMGNMAMMRQGISPQQMAMMVPSMGGGPGVGQGPMGPGTVMSDSDSDASYYPGGPPRYLHKLGRGVEAPPDRKGSHSENRPPYGYPIALDKGKGKEESPDADNPRSFDSRPVGHEHQQDESEVADTASVVDSFVGSNVATVIATEEPSTNSPHQSELTLKLEQTPVAKQAHPYAASQTYHVPTQHHSLSAQAAPESPPDTPTSGPTIHDIRKSWSSENGQRQAVPPLPAVVTEDDINSDTNVQTSLSTAMGVDDYVSASVHLNRNPSVITGAHVSSVAVPLDDSPAANNVDQEKPRSRGAIEPNSYRVSAPPAPRDSGTAVQFPRHGRSVSTSQLNKALPPPPIDVNAANSGFSESTSSLGSVTTPTSGGSPTKRSSLFFRKNGPPSDEQLRELREQETLSKEHIVSWVDRRRPDGKRVFSAGPYDAV